MKTIYLALHLLIFCYCVSCSSEPHDEISIDSKIKDDASDEITDLNQILQIDKNIDPDLDFENLLSLGTEVKTSDVTGVLNYDEKLLPIEPVTTTPSQKIKSKDLEAETAFKNLEVNSLEHKKSIEDLRIINHKKDQTIASLSLLNDELISEIKRIKGEGANNNSNNLPDVGSSNTNLGILKSEVKKLKNNLALKSEELKSLRYRNDSLEGRISQLESVPKISNGDLLPRVSQINPTTKLLISPNYNQLNGNCNFQFEAVVTSLNGKSKEAFYTEFFILPYNLEHIIRKGGIELNDYSGIDTYAELWARSRKNAFLFPDVHKKIRSLLLDFEDNGDGKRIRTDVNGSASINGLKAGKYFVIGTAALGKVGVTWSVPVTLNSGNNKISLTLANCSWSL
ncbi:MAG: hypothetical protein HN548_13850 [Opitutae bacterium]|nr:hypothetical protein [Opitutae bacterium]